MKIFCALFDHKWNYYKLLEGNTRNFRYCKHCLKAQYLAGHGHIYKDEWITMVRRTFKGAKKALKGLI